MNYFLTTLSFVANLAKSFLLSYILLTRSDSMITTVFGKLIEKLGRKASGLRL